MQTMANLPEDILKLVFKSFARLEHYSYRNWEHQLVLLSVCQSWRHFAIPLLCHYARFYFKAPDKKDKDLESIEDSLVTNIDKVMTIGHLDLVRYLDIRVDCNKYIFTCIMLVLKKLSRHSLVWSNMRTMRIESISKILDENDTVDRELALPRIGNSVIDEMAKMMPNIVNLEVQDYYNNISQIQYGRLADSYARNLKTLKSYHPTPLKDIRVFSRLTNLQVGCGNNQFIILPLAHIDTLECLKLHELSESFQWYNIAQRQSKKLVFSNLRILELTYTRSSNISTTSVNTVDSPKLHFPKLQSLTIHNPSEHQQLLSKSVFNSKLEVLDIYASIAYIKQLTCIKLPSIKRLAVNTTFTNHGNLGSEFNVLCNVAKIANTVDNMDLIIINQASIDLTGCDIFPPLTSLEILNIPNYEQAFSLVQRLPLLKELRLNSVNVDNINIDELESLLGSKQGVVPISTSVKHVSVTYRGELLSTGTAIRFTTLLLVGLPALEKLSACQIDNDILLAIRNKRKARYPHLENVQVLD